MCPLDASWDNLGVLFASSQSAYLEYYYSVENCYALIMRVEYYWGLGWPIVLFADKIILHGSDLHMRASTCIAFISVQSI